MDRRCTARQAALVLFWVRLLVGLHGGPAFAQSVALVQGQVVDETGQPVAFANVQIVGTTAGATTGRDGRFAFSTRHLGQHDLSASCIGFEPTRQTMHLVAGDTATVRLILQFALIELGETVVSVSTYTTGEDETVTLSPLDVVTTAGASADIFLAVKTFPGVATVDDGAGLFVRGGDVSETVVLLDQATVVHPYRYESPTGGVFGTISPFMVQGTVFSTGGFSARYGNALSAVLSMESQNMPEQRRYTLGLGLAAGSLALDLPLIDDKLGLRFTGNLGFTDLLFRVNGYRNIFTTTPRGYDGNLNLVYQYSPTGRLKLFNFNSNNRLGVKVVEPSFDGLYRSRTDSYLHNLQWTEEWASWSIQTSASLNRYNARQQLGNLDLTPRDWTLKVRTDLERPLGADKAVRLGAESEHSANRLLGSFPQGAILDPGAAVFEFDTSYSTRRTGAYVETDFRLMRRIVAQVGVRTDHHDLSGRFVVDPRLSARYLLSKYTSVRLAWGIYHQFAAPFEYNPTSGNPKLKAQRAQHWVSGLHHERDHFTARLELYYKPYRNLVIDHPAPVHVANTGEGRASGADLFLKYGAFLNTRLSGWVAYSLLRSRREQVRYNGMDMEYEVAPSPFDITHNLTLVAKARLVGALSGGLTLRHATGRPITPVIDAIRVADQNYHLPVEGPVGSQRLPSFQELDGQLSYVLFFGSGHQAVFYLAIGNLLNRANVLDYDYSIDYTQRQPRTTNFRRSIYFGASFSLNY